MSVPRVLQAFFNYAKFNHNTESHNWKFNPLDTPFNTGPYNRQRCYTCKDCNFSIKLSLPKEGIDYYLKHEIISVVNSTWLESCEEIIMDEALQ